MKKIIKKLLELLIFLKINFKLIDIQEEEQKSYLEFKNNLLNLVKLQQPVTLLKNNRIRNAGWKNSIGFTYNDRF